MCVYEVFLLRLYSASLPSGARAGNSPSSCIACKYRYAKKTIIGPPVSPYFKKNGQPLTSEHKQPNLHAKPLSLFRPAFIPNRLPVHGTDTLIKQLIE